MSQQPPPDLSDNSEDALPMPGEKHKRKGLPWFITLSRQFRKDLRLRILIAVVLVALFVWMISLVLTNQGSQGVDMSMAASELALLRPTLDKQLPIFKHEVDVQSPELRQVYTISPAILHFPVDAGLENIYYGYCNDTDFYVFALKATAIRAGALSDKLGYAHVSDGTSPYQCHPNEYDHEWVVVLSQPMQGGWYLVSINTNVTPDYFH